MKENLAMNVSNENTTRIMALDGTTAEDVVNQRNREKFNQQVDNWADKFTAHSTSISEFAENLSNNLENIEILPIGNYLLVTPFAENPFQRIVRDQKSGLIIDTGGFAPEYKNTDNGQIEEEEQMIKVAAVQAVGPECRWCKEGDAVFYVKHSAVPVPFYKQNLQMVNETRILAVVNEGLEARFQEVLKTLKK